VWLSVPVVLTVVASLVSWLRNRPPRPPDSRRAMQEHEDYLDALVRAARARDRAPHVPPD
jgi:hypothetical protein